MRGRAAVIGRDVEPIIERAGRAAIDARGESSPKSCAGGASGASGASTGSGSMGFRARKARRTSPSGRRAGRARAEPGGSCGRASGSLLGPLASSPDSALRRRAVASARFEFRTRFRASPIASRKRGFIICPRHKIHQRKRSASAVLTSAGACSAPSTVINSIVARARSGVTSSAMIARPSTRILSRSPVA